VKMKNRHATRNHARKTSDDFLAGKRNPLEDHQEYRMIHIFAVVVLCAQSVIYLLTSTDGPVTLVRMTSRATASGWVPSTETICQVRLSTLLVTYLVVASTHHVLVLWVYNRYVMSLVTHGFSLFRWTEYMFTSPLIVVIIAIIMGNRCVHDLFLLAVCQFTTILFGLIWEKRRTSFSEHIMGWVPFCAEWIVLYSCYFSAISKSATTPYFHMFFHSQFVLFCLFGVVQLLQSLNFGPFKNAMNVDACYVFLSLTVKSLMGITVHAGIF